MTVRLLKLRYGPGYFQSPGTVLDLTPEEERQLVRDGSAEPIETAAVAPPENAAAQIAADPAPPLSRKRRRR